MNKIIEFVERIRIHKNDKGEGGASIFGEDRRSGTSRQKCREPAI